MSKLNQTKIPLVLTGNHLSIIDDEVIKFKLSKISDDVFEGHHPNEIDEGWSEICEAHDLPIVGMSWYMSTPKHPMFATSTITEIISEGVQGGIFKTLNSTYRWEVITE
jgi:hypothetical protein